MFSKFRMYSSSLISGPLEYSKMFSKLHSRAAVSNYADRHNPPLLMLAVRNVMFSQAFQQSEEAKQRLVKSYKLMLGFYGIELVDEGTGEVRRANNWEERYSNLNRSVLTAPNSEQKCIIFEHRRLLT